jgi:hypothetical protein
MDASPAVLNAQALRRMQLAAYQRAKLTPPDLSAAALAARDAASLQALEPGGSIEQAIAERLRVQGRDPEAAQGEVERLREAAQQIDQHATPLVGSGEEQPLCHPHHAMILSTQRKRLEGLVNFGLPEFTSAFSWLRDKVTLSTLLTGELNARTFKAPYAQELQPQYWILFDPVFFDFFYHLSNAFASAIDMDGLDKSGNRYAMGDETASVDDAIHWGGPEPVVMAYKMLRSFVAFGFPPLDILPYDDRIFPLAETLRNQAALFVLAHEYAHIIRGDMDNRASHQVPWQAEINADIFGFRMSNAILTMEGAPANVRKAGINLFFCGLLLVELARRALDKGEKQRVADLMPQQAPSAADSHPEAVSRLCFLDDEFSQHFPPDQVRGSEFLTTIFVEITTQFWLRIEPEFLDLHSKGVRAKTVWKGSIGLEQGNAKTTGNAARF